MSNNCLFCKIIAGEIPSTKIYEDDEMLAFKDIHPVSPVHFLVIPKKHIESLMELEAEDAGLVGRMFYKAQHLLKMQGCIERGGRFVINAKSDGGQTVDHLHIHCMGDRAFGWPPG